VGAWRNRWGGHSRLPSSVGGPLVELQTSQAPDLPGHESVTTSLNEQNLPVQTHVWYRRVFFFATKFTYVFVLIFGSRHAPTGFCLVAFGPGPRRVRPDNVRAVGTRRPFFFVAKVLHSRSIGCRRDPSSTQNGRKPIGIVVLQLIIGAAVCALVPLNLTWRRCLTRARIIARQSRTLKRLIRRPQKSTIHYLLGDHPRIACRLFPFRHPQKPRALTLMAEK